MEWERVRHERQYPPNIFIKAEAATVLALLLLLLVEVAAVVLAAGGLLETTPCPCCSACSSLLPTAADPDDDGATDAAGTCSFAGAAPAPSVLSSSSRARRCLSSSLTPLADDVGACFTCACALAPAAVVILLVALESAATIGRISRRVR